MRFVCDSCRAQYMISDDKVGAKGVKVRCKKCGFVILVRRPQDVSTSPGLSDEGATQIAMNPYMNDGPPSADGEEVTNPGAKIPAAGSSSKPGGASILGNVEDDEIGAVFDQVLNSGSSGSSSRPDQTMIAPQGGGSLPAEEDRENTRILDADTVKRLAEAAGLGAQFQEPPKSGKGVGGEAAVQHDWFVAINDQQVGPLNLQKVKERWDRGEIGPDSLCWRAGFADWLPLSDVAELAPALAPQPAKPVIVAPAPVSKGDIPMMSVPVESAFSSGGLAKAARSEAMVAASGSMPEESGSWKPSAASALASLVQEEIQALKKPAPSYGGNGNSEGAASMRNGGLLDLPMPEGRSHTNGKAVGGAPMQPQPVSEGTDPRARTYGADPAMSQPGFTSSPGFELGRGRQSSGSKLPFIVMGAVVLLLVGAVVYLFLQSGKKPELALAPSAQPARPSTDLPMPPPPTAATPPASAKSAEAPAPKAAEAAPAPKPSGGDSDSVAAPKSGAGAPKPAATGSGSKGTRKERGGSRGGGEGEEFIVSSPGGSAPKAPSGADDEFEREFGGGENKKPLIPPPTKPQPRKNVYVPPPAGGADVPDTLGQSDIMQVVLSNRPSIVQCVNEQKKKEPGASGKLVMRWTINTNGRTSNITCESQEYKTSYLAGCIGGLIKNWSFPKHKSQGEPVNFPFVF